MKQPCIKRGRSLLCVALVFGLCGGAAETPKTKKPAEKGPITEGVISIDFNRVAVELRLTDC